MTILLDPRFCLFKPSSPESFEMDRRNWDLQFRDAAIAARTNRVSAIKSWDFWSPRISSGSLTCEQCDWEITKHFRNGQDQLPPPLFRGYDAARKHITIIRGGNLFP